MRIGSVGWRKKVGGGTVEGYSGTGRAAAAKVQGRRVRRGNGTSYHFKSLLKIGFH